MNANNHPPDWDSIIQEQIDTWQDTLAWLAEHGD